MIFFARFVGYAMLTIVTATLLWLAIFFLTPMASSGLANHWVWWLGRMVGHWQWLLMGSVVFALLVSSLEFIMERSKR